MVISCSTVLAEQYVRTFRRRPEGMKSGNMFLERSVRDSGK
jgi:hypothetical protein